MEIKNKLKSILKPRNLVLLLTTAVIILGFYFWQKTQREIKPSYIYGYRLVNEKISQSAPIIIHLPYEMDKSTAQASVEFDPRTEGQWLDSKNAKEIVFKPKEKLELNRYCLVKLTLHHSEASVIAADFLTVEDPQIIAVFPKENSEAPEYSEITIVFNRPMVPLTTLGYLESKDVPVEISPATEGRFKWITTQNLQFIPKERLTRSSNYTVKIKPGLVSMDGLELEGIEIKFVTRKLRYLNLTQDKIVYNQPISIYFNQPVDLEKTRKEITLVNATTGKEVPFTVEYGSKTNKTSPEEDKSFGAGNWYDIFTNMFGKIDLGPDLFKEDSNIDYSIIQIYNQKDRFGRTKFWDFENNYSLKINKAYPLEGDIVLDEGRSTYVYVAGLIKEITAESERTPFAEPDFFDPQGKLWVEFYEEIDLNRSKITAPKLREINYGEKCKDEETVSEDTECEKVTDRNSIYLVFKSEEIGLGETIEINFEKITNNQALVINKEPIKKPITSYPEFAIIKTSPREDATGTSLTEFVFCSNSPILAPAKEDMDKYFYSNLDYELSSWGRSWRIDYPYPGEICGRNQFHTSIFYGLMPNSEYSLEFKLEDVFSQKKDYSIKFRTGDMPPHYLSFYHFQNPYNVTSSQVTGLTYATRNMEYINLEICKLKAFDFLYLVEQKPRYYEPLNTDRCQQVIKDSIELPKRYWIKNYFKINIKDYFEGSLGHYIITFSHPDYTTTYWEQKGEVTRQVFERTYLTVTNLAVAEKRIQPQYATFGSSEPLSEEQLNQLNNIYLVTDMSDLEAVSDAQLTLYRKAPTESFNLIPAGTYKTNEQGLAFASVIFDLRGVVITKGNDSTIIPNYESKLNWASLAASAKKIYLYTDKPIYQPGQEVFLKGIYRIGYDGSYEIYQEKKINLKVFNSRDDEVLNQDLEINDFGTFNTKFVLIKESPLGMYRICAGETECLYIDVQEYVPAAFELNLKSDKEEYISKDIVNLDVEASYYFGVPLESGEVTYTISSQNYYFDKYSDGYFNFGQEWYWWPPYEYGEKFLLRGKTSLDEQGKAKISESLDVGQLFKDKDDRKSKIIIFDVTVQNPQGQSISQQKSFILHAGEFYLGLRADNSFLGKNEKFNVLVKSVDTQGQPKEVKNAKLSLYKVEWIYSKRLDASGGYSYKWEKQRSLINEHPFDTDREGNYSRELKIAEEGEYELESTASDGRGNQVWTIYDIYVYGEKEISVKPTTDTSLELETEKTNLNVGEEGRIIIKSPYSRAKAFISIERGKIFDYQVQEIRGSLFSYTFEVKEEYIPNVFVSVLLISDKPEIKFGSIEFSINTKQKELDIEVTSNKTFYLPGETVSLEIQARGYQGNPISAELSVAVVDLSVLALKGNPKKNPLIFFYDGFPLTVSTASNIKNILVEVEIPTKGGGGMAEKELAGKKRGVFRETAFWEAVVKTDEQGYARVEFELPDNLTTWQVEALGISKDTKLGVDYKEFTTRKELMVVPLKPRFVVPGDVFSIGAKIFNQSGERQSLTITFESQTLNLINDQGEKRIEINPDQTSTVYFNVSAPSNVETGNHVFVISARGQGLEDTVEQTIDITPNYTYEVTATANYTPLTLVTEYVFLPDNVIKDKGELSVKASATLAVFLSDALNYLLQFPYGCSEQIASKLDAIAVIKRGLNVENIGDKFKLEKIEYEGKQYTIEEIVEMGLAELYNNQQYDGGFAFWPGGKSSFHLTLHAVDTLYNLSLAGFKINQDSIDRAASYLYSEIITTDSRLFENKNTVILTAHTLFRLPNFTSGEALRQKIVEIANDELFINDEISNTSLSYLALLLTQGFDKNLKNKIFDTLDARIDIDARGAFLETNKNVIWEYYETSIKNTALYLKAMVADKRQSPIQDKIIRWLLNSRAKDGAWGSTNNTITVIDAFTDFLNWQRETESHFNLELLINESSQGKFEFNPETILEQFQKTVPLSDLKFNEINTTQFVKENLNQLKNNLYYEMALKYYLPVDQIPPRDEGFSIVREIYAQNDVENKKPLGEAKVGDILRVHLQVTVPKTRHYVMVEDFIPAGLEIVNLDLATEQKSLRLQEKEVQDRELYPDFKELYNDRVFLSKEYLGPGVYEFDYWVRALIKGKFSHLPAQASEMYFPENFGRTAGSYFEVK